MESRQLVISPAARDDLQSIFSYGDSIWGSKKATEYMVALQQYLWMVLQYPEIGAKRSGILPALRSFPVKSHIVFYRLSFQQVEIIRVLHSSQDPEQQIR